LLAHEAGHRFRLRKGRLAIAAPLALRCRTDMPRQDRISAARDPEEKELT